MCLSWGLWVETRTGSKCFRLGGDPRQQEKERGSDTEKGRKLVATQGHWRLVLLESSGNSVAH